jgi:hypothetical protein
MAVQVCNLSTWEDDAEKTRVPGQPGLNSKALSQKKKKYLKVIDLVSTLLDRDSPIKMVPIFHL